VLRICIFPESESVIIFSGDALGGPGEEALFTFNEYKGVPRVVDKFNRYGFIVFSKTPWDVISCVWAYCKPLSNAFDMTR
jgi:hypothetical protein